MGILDLLQQDKFWVPGNGPPITLKEMTASHRRNLIAWLERHAGKLKQSYEWSLIAIPGPSGEVAQQCYEDAMTDLWDQDATDWLNETPLMIGLRSREAKYNSPKQLRKRQKNREAERERVLKELRAESGGPPPFDVLLVRLREHDAEINQQNGWER